MGVLETNFFMTKKEIKAELFKIKTTTTELQLKTHVITKEEFIKIVDKLQRQIKTLETSIDED